MCEYCKLETLNEKLGEKSNNCKTIGIIKDGSQIFEVYLGRYKVEKNNYQENLLKMSLQVDVDGRYPVKDKTIKIKYCPFCGEEL